MNKICDANIIIRYLMHDDEILYKKACKEIVKKPLVPFLVLSEIVYVLKGIYKIPKDEIVDALLLLSKEVNYEEAELTIKALKNFKEYNLDFVDCYLLARNKIFKEEVLTFDKKLNNKLKL